MLYSELNVKTQALWLDFLNFSSSLISLLTHIDQNRDCPKTANYMSLLFWIGIVIHIIYLSRVERRQLSYLLSILTTCRLLLWQPLAAAVTHANCTKAFVEKAGHSKMLPLLSGHVCTKQPVGRNVAKICKTQPLERRTTLMWKFLQILRVI